MGEKKEHTSLPPPTSSPIPHPHPQKTAGIGPFGAVLLLSSICSWSDEHGTRLRKWGKKWGIRKKRWRKCLPEYCDKKKMKLFMIMEYNKKKKCVVAFCHFLFFKNLLLLSLFIFEDQYFQGGVLFWRTFSMDAVYVFCIVSCLVYSGCSHHSKWVLAKNKKHTKKSSVLSHFTWSFNPAPFPFCPQRSRQEIGR